jgi:hypothetical protein
MAMSRPQPINVVLVAATSAALHGGAAVLFVPSLSFLLLCWSGTPVPSKVIGQTETGMSLALLAPFVATAFGFIAGAAMAFAHNMFANCQREPALAINESQSRVAQAASLSSAA